MAEAAETVTQPVTGIAGMTIVKSEKVGERTCEITIQSPNREDLEKEDAFEMARKEARKHDLYNVGFDIYNPIIPVPQGNNPQTQAAVYIYQRKFKVTGDNI